MSARTIKIDGKDIRLKATGATSIFYQQVFGEDLLKLFAMAYAGDVMNIDFDVVSKAGFIMAKQAEQEDGTSLDAFQSITEKDYINWADGFSFTGIQAAATDIMSFLNETEKPTADLKKTETKKE